MLSCSRHQQFGRCPPPHFYLMCTTWCFLGLGAHYSLCQPLQTMKDLANRWRVWVDLITGFKSLAMTLWSWYAGCYHSFMWEFESWPPWGNGKVLNSASPLLHLFKFLEHYISGKPWCYSVLNQWQKVNNHDDCPYFEWMVHLIHVWFKESPWTKNQTGCSHFIFFCCCEGSLHTDLIGGSSCNPWR